MDTNENDEKNPVAKLREKFFEKKKNRTPSQEIIDTFKKENEPASDEKTDPDKRVAKPRNPEAGI